MPHQWSNIQELTTMRGRPVYTSDGEKLGDFEEVFHDEATGEAEWIRVKSSTLGGILGTKYFIVPLEGAQLQNGGDPAIRVPYPKERVQDAPDVEGDWISEEDERRLYNYYGLQPSEQRSETQLPSTEADREPSVGTPGEMSVSRREEEMRVGKRETGAGRVRLRKWVETEPVTEDVELRRETARVERHEVNRPASGAEIGEEEAEMRLHREEPVVGKETVERERITVEREEEIEQETVQGEVRREHVEVEEDDSHEGHRQSHERHHDSHEGHR